MARRLTHGIAFLAKIPLTIQGVCHSKHDFYIFAGVQPSRLIFPCLLLSPGVARGITHGIAFQAKIPLTIQGVCHSKHDFYIFAGV